MENLPKEVLSSHPARFSSASPVGGKLCGVAFGPSVSRSKHRTIPVCLHFRRTGTDGQVCSQLCRQACYAGATRACRESKLEGTDFLLRLPQFLGAFGVGAGKLAVA